MSAKHSPSLRKWLLYRLVGILSVIWLVSTGAVLWSAWGEANEAYAGQAVHLAVAMANAFGKVDHAAVTGDTLPESSGRDGVNNFFVVVWKKTEEIYRSANAPANVPVNTTPGEQMEGTDASWLLATQTNADGNVTATVGLLQSEATLLSLQAAASVALPMLVGFVCVVIAVVAGVRLGLKPVDRLRHHVLDRSPAQLDPIVIDAPPEELRPMIESINDLLERLSGALETERRFIADASHELRTPLTAIKAQIQAINRSRIDLDSLASVDNIHHGIDRATRLVEQLLTLARSEADSAPRVNTRVDLAAIAGDEVSELFPQAVDAGIELEFAGAPAVAQGNTTELSVLARNLVDNAIRYSGSGATVRVATGSTNGSPFITVEDSGPGMSDDEMAHAFARFKRGPNVSGMGSGLGLSIVRSIVERHGGTAGLRRSQELGGLLVTCRFPKRIPSEQ